MSFQQVSIKNFRAIESLEMDNIKQVNLLTGKNNCGKTSVLEAIFLLAGMSNPRLVLDVHHFRQLALANSEEFRYLFNGLDLSRDPSITGRRKSETRSLEMRPVFRAFMGEVSGEHHASEDTFIPGTSTVTKDTIEKLALDFSTNGNEPFHAEIRLNDKRFEFMTTTHYKEYLKASFIYPRMGMDGLNHRLGAILVRKGLNKIINPLKEIEPNLSDIRIGAEGIIYADTGMDELLPINVMGDGIIKILTILVAMLEMENGILLIDEIENGLHHSALVPLWKAIFKMASASNVQLFIATHSYECIDAMADVYRESGMGEDFISLFRIEQDEGGRHYAVRHKANTLLTSIEKNFEVR
ncbi:MAG: ATPase/GTPase, AAA15 family [Candidatus Kentron sp. G]|nr:MAG: ATPase/GTPase, AAA15 family [Candidatus Kentron sp. G]VFM97299.1 MAG: ATPase/GTPase, AAA15 family [Candidatus Kentron sp. G]VFM99527.1 MAG: ATPase/GTPase, AAA15 family [Candidatus Kentron sp. G]